MASRFFGIGGGRSSSSSSSRQGTNKGKSIVGESSNNSSLPPLPPPAPAARRGPDYVFNLEDGNEAIDLEDIPIDLNVDDIAAALGNFL